MDCEVKQDLHLGAYAGEWGLFSEPTYWSNGALFQLLHTMNALWKSISSNLLKDFIYHFFACFLSNRYGWTIWSFKSMPSFARLYCLLHFGFQTSVLLSVCCTVMNRDMNDTLSIHFINIISLHSAATDSPFTSFLNFTNSETCCVFWWDYTQVNCNNCPPTRGSILELCRLSGASMLAVNITTCCSMNSEITQVAREGFIQFRNQWRIGTGLGEAVPRGGRRAAHVLILLHNFPVWSVLSWSPFLHLSSLLHVLMALNHLAPTSATALVALLPLFTVTLGPYGWPTTVSSLNFFLTYFIIFCLLFSF